MRLITFHKPKCIVYLILIGIIRTLNNLIRNLFKKEDFSDPFFRIFIMFFSKMFAIYYYLVQKKINIYNKLEENDISIEIHILKLNLMMIWISLSAFLSNFQFKNLYYSYSMKQIDSILIENYELIILFLNYFFI